jgi:hypothetical protein
MSRSQIGVGVLDKLVSGWFTVSMQITTNARIDPMRRSDWAVVAEWLGTERIVFTGSIFECIAYTKENA